MFNDLKVVVNDDSPLKSPSALNQKFADRPGVRPLTARAAAWWNSAPGPGTPWAQRESLKGGFTIRHITLWYINIDPGR